MIISLDEVKAYIRMEPEYTDEDIILQMLTKAAESYLKNATGVEFDGSNDLAKLFCATLIVDWYENRQYVGKASENTKETVKSILAQLEYCYPIGEVAL